MNNINKLRDELEVKQKEFDEISSKCYTEASNLLMSGDKSLSFRSIELKIKEQSGDLLDEISEISFKLKKMEKIEYTDIPKYGDLMTLEEFIDNVECGGFIDYDGWGKYATSDKMSNKTIRPSNVKSNRLLTNDEFTHVVWFNR